MTDRRYPYATLLKNLVITGGMALCPQDATLTSLAWLHQYVCVGVGGVVSVSISVNQT